MQRPLKNYQEFLYEETDKDPLGLGADTSTQDKEKKKEEPVDPEVEVEKERKKREAEVEKARKKVLDKEKSRLEELLPGTISSFQEKFTDRLKKAINQDDRVEYRDLVLDIQRFQMGLAKEQQEDAITEISPIIELIQRLNKSEYTE
jgi:hypothetical protein